MSSNYELYGDMSQRVMRLLAEFSDKQEVYSIDESFLILKGHQQLNNLGQIIRNKLWKWLGMPVCVGIASTKTLAKFANHCAKKEPLWNGVCNISSLSDMEVNQIMDRVEVGKVWGIGYKTASRLRLIKINSVLDLKLIKKSHIKKQFNINVERTIYELNQMPCFSVNVNPEIKKTIVSSRSFGSPVKSLGLLTEVITTFVTRAALKARQNNIVANYVYIFIGSSPFNKNSNYYANSIKVRILYSTNNTQLILASALSGLKIIFRPNISYIKCGVSLLGLEHETSQKNNLWTNETNKSINLIKVIDEINYKFDKKTLRLATQPINPIWGMRQKEKSPAFTTSWKNLLLVN